MHTARPCPIRRRLARAIALALIVWPIAMPSLAVEVRFVRGDVSQDGELQITDAVATLAWLFAARTPGCIAAADVDDSDSVELTDAIVLLDHLFRGGPPPRPPYPECGLETGVSLPCEEFLACPQDGEPPGHVVYGIAEPLRATSARQGHRVAFASTSGVAMVVDAARGEVVRWLSAYAGQVHDVALTSSGDRIATAGQQAARLWNVDTGRMLHDLVHDQRVTGVGFSPDDSRLYVVGDFDDVIEWNGTTGDRVRDIEGQTTQGAGRVGVVATHDGRRLVLLNQTNSFDILDLESGETRRGRLRGSPFEAVITPDSSRVLLATGPTVDVFDLASGDLLREIRVRTRSVDLSADGTVLARSNGAAVEILDAASEELLDTLDPGTGTVHAAALSADGTRVLATTAGGFAWIWEVGSGRVTGSISGHHAAVLDVAASTDSRLVVTASLDGRLLLWDARRGRILRSLEGHRLAVLATAFSPDGSLVLSGSADRTARLWSADTGRLVRLLDGHTHRVGAVAISSGQSPGGALAATGCADGTVRIFDVTTGELRRSMRAGELAINGIAFAPDGGELATASADGRVRVIDVAGDAIARTFPIGDAALRAIDWSPDGALLAVGDTRGALHVIEADDGDRAGAFDAADDWLSAVRFSPDGTTIATASGDGTARILDRATGRELRRITGHVGPVHGVAFTRDGSSLLTCGEDRTARGWEVGRGD